MSWLPHGEQPSGAAPWHDASQPALLGAYTLELFDDEAEHARISAHLAECARCRAEHADHARTVQQLAALKANPTLLEPEWLDLDRLGSDARPSELLLHRTLGQVRGLRRRSQRSRLVGVAAAVAVLLAGAGVSGAVIGRHAGRPAPAAVAAGSRTFSATGPGGTRMEAMLTPEGKWTRLRVHLTNEPAGARCQLIAVAADGTRRIAGSWAVDAHQNGPDGTRVTSSVAIPADQVRQLEVQTLQGEPVLTLGT